MLAPCPSRFFSSTITRIPKFTFHFVLKPVLCTNTSNQIFLHQAPLLKFNIEFYLLYLLNALSSYLTSSDFVCEKIWLSLIFFFTKDHLMILFLFQNFVLRFFPQLSINELWIVKCFCYTRQINNRWKYFIVKLY